MGFKNALLGHVNKVTALKMFSYKKMYVLGILLGHNNKVTVRHGSTVEAQTGFFLATQRVASKHLCMNAGVVKSISK